MPIALDLFCFAIPLTMFFDAVLYFATGVGGCWWNISYMAVLTGVAFWKFSNNTPYSTSADDAMELIIMLHYTCTGPFYGGIYCIGVLDFGRRKNPPALLHASGSDI